MTLVGVFGVALLIAVLVSGLAARSVLSTSLLFLAAGALVGRGGLGLVDLGPESRLVGTLADLALFTVLYTDGMRVGLPELRRAWRGPGQALLLGMPLTFLGIALLARALAGVNWITAFLIGAVLSPTDPVFASAIVGRQDVPARLRQLLNVESGLNDGLALPVVLVLIASAGHGGLQTTEVFADLAGGVLVGLALPLVVLAVLRIPVLGAEPRLQPLGPLALGIVLYAICHVTHANAYLAAFTAGATLASVSPAVSHAFEAFGDLLAELSKFAALLVFGALLEPALFGRVAIGAYVVAVLALLAVRPLAMMVSLVRTPLDRKERAAAAWFGPKGFASVVYGLLVLEAGIPEAGRAFDLIAVCIALSIVAHSSTDVPVARLFHVAELAGIPEEHGAHHPRPRPPDPSSGA